MELAKALQQCGDLSQNIKQPKKQAEPQCIGAERRAKGRKSLKMERGHPKTAQS